MIAIFLNSVEWGGVDVVVGRFAKYLSSRGAEFCIIEPEGGRLRKELPQTRFVRPDQVHLVANHVTHLFSPTISRLRDPQFPWESLAHASLLTWVVHPNDVFLRFFPFSGALLNIFGYRAVSLLRRGLWSHTRLLDALFATLIKEKALIVMDGATRRSLKFFFPKLPTEPEIVPIPSPLVDVSPVRYKGAGDLSIGYLGRMDAMKWSAIRPFILYTLAPIALQRKITLHFVSEGSHLSRLKKLCSDSGMELHCYGYLPNQQAREVIVTRTDLAVAMGTSALDIAGAGHPCVMLDPSLGLFAPRQKRFRFVHESEGHTLGEYRDFPNYVGASRSFQELLDGSQLETVSLQERNYVQRAHDPIQCFDALLNRIHDSTLMVAELATHMHMLQCSFDSAKSRPFSHVAGIAPGHVR